MMSQNPAFLTFSEGAFHLSELTSLANQLENRTRDSENLALKILQNAHSRNGLQLFEGDRKD